MTVTLTCTKVCTLKLIIQDGDAIDDIAKVDAAKTAHKHVCALLIALEKYDTPSANGQKQQRPPLLEGITYMKGETIDMNKYCERFCLVKSRG